MAKKLTLTQFDKGLEGLKAHIRDSVSPFPDDTPEKQKKRKERAARDLEYFGQTYFPHYITSPPSALHKYLCRTYQEAILNSVETGEGHKQADAAPRGNAKSTWASLVLPTWCVAFEYRRFIALLSDSTGQANEYLEFIKAELEENPRLAHDFPDACGEGSRWRTGDIITRNRIKIKCWGTGKKIRGARHGQDRPDLVIGDDLENDEHVQSQEQRSKTDRWLFRAVLKMGSRKTVYLVVGTILHYDSQLSRLLLKPGWLGRKFQSVIKWSESPKWEEWEKIITDLSIDGDTRPAEARAFFEKHRAEMLASTEVLWPDVEDYYYLMVERLDGPAHFDSEKQNEPINPEDCLFQEEWFQYFEPGEEHLAAPAYCYVDPSMGKQSAYSDPSAIIVAIRLPNGYIDIVVADIEKRHPDKIITDFLAYYKRFRFSAAGVEETQFQEFFKDTLLKESARTGLYPPVQGVKPVSDKKLRISSLQPWIKNGFIRFRKEQRTLLEQLKFFPKSDHDDGPDALEGVVKLIEGHAGGIEGIKTSGEKRTYTEMVNY